MTPEVANHRQIHAGVHQAKRIASGDDTIKRRQILETPTNNLNLWMRTEPPAKDIAELLASIYKNQSHSCWREPPNKQSAAGFAVYHFSFSDAGFGANICRQ